MTRTSKWLAALLVVSVLINLGNLLYDGLPIAAMMIGICMR